MSATIVNKLSLLSKEKQLVFGLLAAERYFICYKLFSQKENFGNMVEILESINLIEGIALGKKVNVDLVNDYAKRVDENIPDIDDFGSVGSSLALNVGCIVFETLNLIIREEYRILNDISTYCTDIIDFVIFKIEGYDPIDLEKVSNHYLMIEELELQESIINYLERVSGLNQGDIEALRLMQSETGFHKLNLEEIFAE